MQIELLTIGEFCERARVARSTVFDWMKRGRLQPGRHYIRLGRTIRFPWGDALISALLQASEPAAAPETKSPRARPRGGRPKGPAVNLDYR